MKAFLLIVRLTVRQLLGGKRIWALGALAALPAVVMFFGGRDRTAEDAFEFFHEAPLATMFLVVLPIIPLILGAAALGDERRQHTLSFIALRPLPRWNIVVAKLTGAWVASFAVTGSGSLLLAVALGTSGGGWGPTLPVVLGAAISTLAYAALFIVLGYLFERAVIFGLAYIFLWEAVFTSSAPGLAPASLGRIGLSAYAALVDGAPRLLADPLGSLAPGAGGAILKTAFLAALVVAGLSRLFVKRDLV
ncbi:MAG: ABC transporter permease [Acidimicrobiia bacterium]|nr:ABC transporter permease [Acidimicrobiia bacterium]MDH3470671.1 ABC transporter permease [Acidimicrobiia bacterium]